MGIVLASVGTNDLTLVDWVKGLCGGLAAYLAMLIFTREITTAQIGRAASVVTDRLAVLKPSPARALPAPAQDHLLASPREAEPPLLDESEPARESEHAERTYRRADAAADAGGAFNLGVLLHQRRDFAAATAAYGRAEQQRGSRCRVQSRGSALRAGRPCRR